MMQMMAHEMQYHHELNMELQGVPHSSSLLNIDNLSAAKEMGSKELDHNYELVDEDDRIMSELFLSRRIRGLIKSMKVCFVSDTFFGKSLKNDPF